MSFYKNADLLLINPVVMLIFMIFLDCASCSYHLLFFSLSLPFLSSPFSVGCHATFIIPVFCSSKFILWRFVRVLNGNALLFALFTFCCSREKNRTESYSCMDKFTSSKLVSRSHFFCSHLHCSRLCCTHFAMSKFPIKVKKKRTTFCRVCAIFYSLHNSCDHTID